MLGIGTDIVELDRVRRGYERFGEHYLARILSEEERAHFPGDARAAAWLAGRWAAKEALAKALGTGFSGGIGPRQLRIFNREDGSPYVVFTDDAKDRFEAMGGRSVHLSISHERSFAVAFAVIE